MNLGSIYHRMADNYCYPLNEDELIINLKTGYDIQKVYIHYGDPYLAGIMGGKEKWTGKKEEICFKKRLKQHLWWTTTLKPEYKRCKYYFELHTETECMFYFEDGFYTKEEMEYEGKSLSYFIFPWMNEADIFQTPHWVNETVWYQIFPERFCNGNPKLNPENTKEWKCETPGYEDYYGGDLQGIMNKLPYLQSLGITGIYLTPVFEAHSNHKYNTLNYRKVDPNFGTNEDLKKLVAMAHEKGIRVMLDGVFNHTGVDIDMWQSVLDEGKQSPYAEWYMIKEWPVEMGRSTKDGRFFSFSFSDRMPKLNTNHPEVIQYFLDIVKFWMWEFDIDGLRLDVGNEVSHRFLRELRRMCKKEKPDFYLLGEIWHDSINWLLGEEYDAVMNYPLASGISDFWVFKNWEKSEFEYAINRCFTMYMQQTNDVLFNLLDSHDTNRLIDKVKSEDVFYQQLAVLFTMPGSPCIYYGTEIVMEGEYDPDCRRCMPWNEIDQGIYEDKMQMIRTLIGLRKEEAAFRSRDFHFTNEFSQPRLVEYIKIDGERKIQILLNCEEADIMVGDKNNVLYQRKYENGILKKNGILIYES